MCTHKARRKEGNKLCRPTTAWAQVVYAREKPFKDQISETVLGAIAECLTDSQATTEQGICADFMFQLLA